MPEFDVAAEFGINGGTDETTEFETLRQHAIANPGSTYLFAPGVTYQYTTPKWLAEVQDVTIMAIGSSFENLASGTFSYSDMDASVVLGSGPPFHGSQGTGQIDPDNANSGDLIEDANTGDVVLTFVTACDTVNYDVGDKVLIRWFSRQADSFPPNPGYFDYRIVESIDQPSAGQITLTLPLTNDYRAIAPDDLSNPAFYDISEGKARCLNLTRSDYTIAGRINWNGGIGVVTGNATNFEFDGTLQVEGVMECYIADAQFEGVFPTASQRVEISNSSFLGNVTDFDKIVDIVKMTNCNINKIQQGTGIKEVQIVGGSLTGEFQLRSKSISIIDVDIHTQSPGVGGSRPTQLVFDQYPRRDLTIDKCVFYPDQFQHASVLPGNILNLTIDENEEDTLIFRAANPLMFAIKRNIDLGAIFSQGDSVAPYNELRPFFVTDISFNDDDDMIVKGTSPRGPLDGNQARLWSSPIKFKFGALNRVLNAPPGYLVIREGTHLVDPVRTFWRGDGAIQEDIESGQL